jgi:hypothetical protein
VREMLVAAENPIALCESRFYFGVAGQGASIAQAKALDRLFLGDAEIRDALFLDDPGRLVGDCGAPIVRPEPCLPAHVKLPSAAMMGLKDRLVGFG